LRDHLVMAIKQIFSLFFIWGWCILILSGCAGTMQSKDPIVSRREAVLAYKEGRFNDAAAKFEQLVTEVPKDSELWFRLGNSYAKADKPDLAITAYRNALLRNPEFGKAWYNLGVIQMQAALKAFIDMQKYVPENDPASIAAEKKREGLFLLLKGKSSE